MQGKSVTSLRKAGEGLGSFMKTLKSLRNAGEVCDKLKEGWGRVWEGLGSLRKAGECLGLPWNNLK